MFSGVRCSFPSRLPRSSVEEHRRSKQSMVDQTECLFYSDRSFLTGHSSRGIFRYFAWVAVHISRHFLDFTFIKFQGFKSQRYFVFKK